MLLRQMLVEQAINELRIPTTLIDWIKKVVCHVKIQNKISNSFETIVDVR